MFGKLNCACNYHFVDKKQQTARFDKPEWIF